jgi:predicted RNase H-like HicB family nuclease
MQDKYKAIVQRDGEWFIAYCPEIPGANGQGRTRKEALESFYEAIVLIQEVRRDEGFGGIPLDASKPTERERQLLQLLARGEQEIAAGKGYDLATVLAELDELFERGGTDRDDSR